MQGKKYSTPRASKNSQSRQVRQPTLPPIPDKRYFTIGEAALLCGVKPHVLRYWEQEFPTLNPVKRRGNRRYYQLRDVLLIRAIRKLLYVDGFTIDGARAQLVVIGEKTSETKKTDTIIKKVIAELELVLQNLTTAEETA
jgi:DNA-binding transcriptional MerR regulator